MAASANRLATEAGCEILKRGGAFVVYWDNRVKKLTTFDACETAPQSAVP
ncbi:hypothetical protein V6667_09795 [Neisseria leonii]|uniref:Uncharacterized protein n=1 Tax=Neisseria leonii TaxID=2995413 RepID=A0A9X4E2E7_9NEIS|nr:hypothetical protein [Neisseria sp. 51.81]MDD9328203.1 hypothetical protein [Neisseria sp. 51.81]